MERRSAGAVGTAVWLLWAALAAVSAPIAAQEAPAPEGTEAGPRRRPPGRFRVGPFYVTPTFRIGSVGLDSNVFYTATDRQTDLTANGGPGLEIVLPAGHAVQFFVAGDVDYVYFVRTESQRRFGGGAGGGLRWEGNRFQGDTRYDYRRSFQRPSFEVDRRMLSTLSGPTAELRLRTVGRLTLRTELSSQRLDVAAGQDFFGADLQRTLSRDAQRAELDLEYAVTPKTYLVLGGDYQLDRFLLDAGRDADSNRAFGGFRIDSETRLFGAAVGGVRFFRVLDTSRGPERRAPYAAVDLSYRMGSSTLLNASFDRDLQYSAFNTPGTLPTLSLTAYGGRIEKGLIGRLELHVFGRISRLRTDAAVTIVRAGGDSTTAKRDDTAREAGADLGFRFRPSFRIGVAATYTDRRSTIADFGIEGFLVGATVKYNPGRR